MNRGLRGFGKLISDIPASVIGHAFIAHWYQTIIVLSEHSRLLLASAVSNPQLEPFHIGSRVRADFCWPEAAALQLGPDAGVARANVKTRFTSAAPVSDKQKLTKIPPFELG